MLHLHSAEVTAIFAFLAVGVALAYSAATTGGGGRGAYALIAGPPSLGTLLTLVGFIIMLRRLAGGRECDAKALQSLYRQQSMTTTNKSGNGASSASNGAERPPRVVLVTGADGVMGSNLCRSLLATGNVIVIACCRTARQSAALCESLNAEAKSGPRYSSPSRARAVCVAGVDCDSASVPSITAYVRALRALLAAEALVLDTAVLAVGMISPTLRYVDVSSGEEVPDPFGLSIDAKANGGGAAKGGGGGEMVASLPPLGDSICEVMLATNGVGAHHFASLLMPLLARGGGATEGAASSAPTSTSPSSTAFEHPRRLIITASSAHSHLGALGASPPSLIRALHRFGGIEALRGPPQPAKKQSTEPVAKTSKEGADAKSGEAEGESKKPSVADEEPPANTSGPAPPAPLARAIARAAFYPDFVKVYGLSKLMNLYSGYTLIEMADRQRAAAARARLASGVGVGGGNEGIAAKLAALPQGDCDATGGGAKIVKIAMLHPGIFGSGLYRRLLPRPLLRLASLVGLAVMKTGHESCQTALQCVAEDWGSLVHGGYYYDCREYGPSSPVWCSLSEAAMDGEMRRMAVEWMNATIMAATRRARAAAQKGDAAAEGN